MKSRFYLQPLSPAEAIARAKESAKDIVAVKALIDKKAWPYVQNDLRLKASYLRFDLNTIVASKAKEEKKELKALIAKLYDDINNVRDSDSFFLLDLLEISLHEIRFVWINL